MSNKYLVLADVDGEIRFMSMRSNGSREEVEQLSHQMAEKLFSTSKVGDLWVEPWPLDVSDDLPYFGVGEPQLSRLAVNS